MKVHYTRITVSKGMLHVKTPCGAMMTNSTKNKKKVTCRTCRKIMKMCKHCHTGTLSITSGAEPFDEPYWICSKCDSTYCLHTWKY